MAVLLLPRRVIGVSYLVLARMRLLVRRFWIFLVAYLFAILLVAEAQPLFVPVDMAIAGALLGTKQPAQLDRSIILVDLKSYPRNTWSSVVTFLSTVSRAVRTRAMTRPAAIVLDMYFSSDNYHSEPGTSATAVANAIRAVRDGDARTRVFAVVNPYESGSTKYQDHFFANLDSSIYDALTGSGHTEWFIAGNGRIGWYRATIPESAGNAVFAIPLVLRDDFGVAKDSVYGFIIGPARQHVYTLQEVTANPALLNDKLVVVGSSKVDTHNGIPGMLFTAWAISDRLTAGNARHVSLFSDAPVVLGFSLGLSLLSLAAFVITFWLVRSLEWRLLASSTAGVLVPIGVLLIVVLGYAAFNVIYVRPTFGCATILIAALASWSAGRVQIRYDRVVSGFEEGKTEVRRRADVFVSYSRDDENIAWVEERVVKPLRSARRSDGTPLDVFFDLQKIHAGMAWYKTIVEALWGCRYMIVVYTPRYFERPMCTEELLTAMRRCVNDAAFTILPVSRMAAAVPPEFAGIQLIDAVRQPNFMDEIIATICAPTAPQPASTVTYDSEKVKAHAQEPAEI
ncbi:MAG: hypothetical protein NVSMB64_02600 [Candidatus Velthaea sp.]